MGCSRGWGRSPVERLTAHRPWRENGHSWQSCEHPAHSGARDATTTFAMAFLKRHNRALLCIAAGLLLGALTYQPPV
jgi:hypothetical protein